MKIQRVKSFLIIFILLQNFNLYSNDIINKNLKLLNIEDRQFLDEIGTIKMIVDDQFSPISYYDNESGEFKGIAVDTIEALSKVLDFKYEIIRDENLSWSERVDLIRNNKIDILGGASINNDRLEFGYFTQTPYFINNYALTGSINNHKRVRNLEDINNYQVGLVIDVAINNTILEVIRDKENITYYNTIEEGLEGLRKGEIDLLPENEAVFIEEYFSGIRFDFEIIYRISEAVKRYSFFTPKTEKGKRLSEILDKGMKQINVEAIVNARYGNKSIFSFYKEYIEALLKQRQRREIIIGMLALIIVMILILIFILHYNNKVLKIKAVTDHLTGLKNRSGLFSDYSNPQNLSNVKIFFIDLDDFKCINDKFGHEAGDLVLKEVSSRMKVGFPKADIYRIGGDEFLIITKDDNSNVENNIQESITKPIISNSETYKIRASIGWLRTSTYNTLNLDKFINLADHTMLEAKSVGKNKIIEVNFDNTKG